MRVAVTVLVLVAWPSTLLAFECVEFDASKEPVERHIELATDVVFGRVLGGRIREGEGSEFSVTVTVGVIHRFKGQLPDVVELNSGAESPYPEMVLGHTYIFFLYGDRRIDFCGYLIPVRPALYSLDRLVQRSEAISDSSAEIDRHWDNIARVLSYSGVGP